MNDWMRFHFLTEESLQVILDRFRVVGKGSLVFFRWHTRFNPWKEKVTKRQLWVILLGLSLQCWSFEGFMLVSNAIGRFILVEEETLNAVDRRLPPVLVEIDSSECLPMEVDVIWNGGFFTQQIDY